MLFRCAGLTLTDDNGCRCVVDLMLAPVPLAALFRVLRVTVVVLIRGLAGEATLIVRRGLTRLGVGPLRESVEEVNEAPVPASCISSSCSENGVGGDRSPSSAA
jgi:hypothetical protein